MTPNRLPLMVLLADTDSRGPRGRPQNTWKALIQNDSKDLSQRNKAYEEPFSNGGIFVETLRSGWFS
jgi:hypothetical protein